MQNAEPRRSSADVRDELDDSWFDRPDRRKIAAELRDRIGRQSTPWAAQRAGAAPASGGGLDDSWFK